MEQVLEYIKRAHQGDKAARDLLVQNNLGLVWSIVRRFSNRGYDPEDLFQVGSIGLLKAIDRFDTDYEVKFSTYAVPLIIGEIRRYLRDDGMLKVSRTLKEAAWKVDTAFSGTRSDPSHRGMIAGIGVENFHPGALTVGVICGILNELHEQYEQMCQLTGKKATRLTGSGNGIRRNSLMRRLAEEMFKMPMEIPEYEEEAAYGAALTAGKLVAAM